jgi:hypothetical protein
VSLGPVRADQLVRLLWGATRLAGGWLARCPLHPESGRDLFVYGTPRTGQAVVSCRYRCTLSQIVNAALEQEYRATRRRRGAP